MKIAAYQAPLLKSGSINIIDPDGKVIASSKPLVEDLLIAEIKPKAHKYMRGWDALKNPAIAEAFIQQCYPHTRQNPVTIGDSPNG